MFRVPTMTEWHHLTKKFPEYQDYKRCFLLKDFGYMFLRDYLDQRNGLKVLEFGHLFNEELLSSFKLGEHELWGVDDAKPDLSQAP
ncbi:hypothetical protein ACLF3G_11815 [Falsiroseomonas sp. HC035]|uniref:hypothetical protein n=1 Tax=Falsiroseomonas sp. HC035 TaxID=3390999 RepID=UPI003D31FA97